MIDARLLATDNNDSAKAVDVYGVWIPRKGDNARFTVEVIWNYGTNLQIEVYQKNYGDAGDGAATGVLLDFGQTDGRQTMELEGCKELVRFRLHLLRGDDLADSDVGLVLFRFLQPVWFEAVKV